jgi:hypothetical protein
MKPLVPSDQRHHYTFVPAFTVEDPQFRRALDGFGSVMVGGNAAVLLENGDGVFPAMTKDIREAKVSVDIEVYIFKPDEAGRLFADAMIEAARRGVEVRLLVDDQGGKLGNLKKELEAAEWIARNTGPSGVTPSSEGGRIASSSSSTARSATRGDSASTSDGSETPATRPSGTTARSG